MARPSPRSAPRAPKGLTRRRRGPLAGGTRARGSHGDTSVDVGNAGTVMRFVPPVAALAPGRRRVPRRPARLAAPGRAAAGALRELGAGHRRRGPRRRPVHRARHRRRWPAAGSPSTPRPPRSSSPACCSPRPASTRAWRSATAAPAGAVRAAHRDDGADAARRGRRSGRAGRRAAARPGRPTRGGSSPGRSGRPRVGVEPDLSNAAPFLAAAAGHRRDRDHRRLARGTPSPRTTSCPARQLRAPAGTWTGGALTVTGHRHDPRHHRRPGGLQRDGPGAHRAGRAGRRRRPGCTGIGHMRAHETDRLAALAHRDQRARRRRHRTGGRAGRSGPGRCAAGGRPFASYDDHRMVMAAAVLGLAVPGITVANAAHRRQDLPRASPGCGRRCWSRPSLTAPARDLDEDDIRVRPGRGSRPRTRRRPAHEDAAEGVRGRRRPGPVRLS